MNPRDYIAGIAFRELLARRSAWAGIEEGEVKQDRIKALAEESYRIADTFLGASSGYFHDPCKPHLTRPEPDVHPSVEGWAERNREGQS